MGGLNNCVVPNVFGCTQSVFGLLIEFIEIEGPRVHWVRPPSICHCCRENVVMIMVPILFAIMII